MTVKETVVFLTAAEDAYPGFYKGRGEEAAERALKMWVEDLEDVSFESAYLALKRYRQTNKFPPTIADIRESVSAVTQLKIPSADEGWGEVRRAIARFGYMRPLDAIDSMSEITAKVVRGMGFRELCESENPIADRARFTEYYNRHAREKTTQNQMSAGLQKEIDATIAANQARLAAMTAQVGRLPGEADTPRKVVDIRGRLGGGE